MGQDLTSAQILRQAFSMVLGNLGVVARLTLPAFAAFAVLQFFAPSDVYAPLLTTEPGAEIVFPDGYGRILAIWIGYMLLSFVCMAIIAVLWHRHVLLAADSHADARDVPNAVILFLVRSFKIGIALVGLSIPIVLVVGIVATVTGAFDVLMILSSLLVFWITLRLSLGLPAAAISKSIGLRQSWEATAPVATALWPIALVQMMLQLLASIVPVLGLVVIWFALLVGASILTTLYGVLIEGRPLPKN